MVKSLLEFNTFIERQKVKKEFKEKILGRSRSHSRSSSFPKSFLHTWEEHIKQTYKCKCYKCPGLYANEVKKFVGWRGFTQQASKSSHAQGELCVLDITGDIHEGEAHPEPRLPVTKINRGNLIRLTGKTKEELGRVFYLGVLEYEVAIMTLVYTLRNMGYTNIMILMGRGSGKTYMEDWENSMEMKYFGAKVLLLSESDATLMVGNWIYLWGYKNKFIKNPERYEKKSTYQHFELKNGAKLDVYSFMDKRTLGMHEYKIVGDDIVNLDWQNRPADDKRARVHWASNLNNIIRTAFIAWGTRKYEDDLLEYFMNVIEDLVIIKLSPFIACEHQPFPNENGVFDECHICKDKALLAPEIHSYEELMDKKEEDYDAWHSENMQNPHRQEGGMIDPEDVHYDNNPPFANNVLYGGTSVDCADTLDEANDMVGIVSGLLQDISIEKKSTRRFHVVMSDVERRLARNVIVKEKKKYADWTDPQGHRWVRGIIETVQLHCEWWFLHYPNIPYLVAWERNRSGIAILEQALREFRNKEKVEIERGKWVTLTWPRYMVSDQTEAVKWERDGTTNVPLGITHRTDKVKRIYSGIQYSIKKGQITFNPNQRHTVLMNQLLGFPKAKHDDGPDALEMLKSELNKRWYVREPKPKPIQLLKDKRKKEQIAEKFKLAGQPWLKNAPRRQRRMR